MSLLRLFFTVLVVALLTGCAASRSVITPSVVAGVNPDKGTAVRIDKVTDERVFQAAPPQPDTPSLNEEEIGDRALTARALGRKRNGYGKAMGDVVLPEGQSVSQLVSAALSKGLRESGYRVLNKGDAGYEQATPVSARVDQFWSWINPGFATIKVSSRIDVALSGDLKAAGGKKVTAENTDAMQVVTENDWLVSINKALEAWVTNLKTALRP